MANPTFKSLPEMNEEKNMTKWMIILLILFIAIVLIYWAKFLRKSSRNSILLVGLCESGKTLVFTQAVYAQVKETFTSMLENVADFEGNSKPLKLVDVPGHERLRGKFFDQYKSSAKGLVYVIDSVTFQKDIRDVADFLYTILSDREVNNIPILILCNKQDEALAKGCNIVKQLLEKEINLVRTNET